LGACARASKAYALDINHQATPNGACQAAMPDDWLTYYKNVPEHSKFRNIGE